MQLDTLLKDNFINSINLDIELDIWKNGSYYLYISHNNKNHVTYEVKSTEEISDKVKFYLENYLWGVIYGLD